MVLAIYLGACKLMGDRNTLIFVFRGSEIREASRSSSTEEGPWLSAQV